MKRRIVSVLLCLTMTMMLVAGCGGKKEDSSQSEEVQKTEETKESEPISGGNLSIPIGSDLKSFNYGTISGDDDAEMVLSTIYDELCSVTSDGVRYYLAESCELSEDGTTMTVKLRDDLKWHDGEKITADDLIYTIEWLQNSDNQKGTDNMRVTSGGQPLTTEKVDDLTVKVISPYPHASMMYSIGELHIMPKHIWEDDSLTDEEKYSSAIGSGPYKLKEYIPGEKIVVEKNEDYYRTEPSLDTIEFKIMPDFSAREVAFQNGEINMLRVTDAKSLEAYENNEDYKVYNFPEGRINFLIMSNKGILQDKKARQAVCLALNIPEIVEGVYGDDTFAVPANSMFSRLSYFYIDEYVNYEQNLEEAKKLAEEAGIVGKKLTYVFNNNRTGMESTALMIQQQLKEIGVEVEVQGLDSAGFFAAQTGAQPWDFLTSGYMSNGEEFHSMPFYTSAYGGYMGYDVSQDVDAAWGETEMTTNMEARKAGAEKAYKAAQDCYSLVSISDTNYVVVMQNNYEGFEDYGMNTLFEDFTKFHLTK